MSTRIPTGFRFRSPDFPAAWAAIVAFREALAPIVETDVARLHADWAVTILDDVTLGGAARDRSPLSTASFDFLERAKTLAHGPHRDPEVDFHCDLYLFPVRGMLLGIIDTERDAYAAQWMQTAPVEPFAYWNNTDDRPEGVTEADWDARGDLWDEALTVRGYARGAKRAGLTAQCVDAHLGLPPVDDVLAHVPSLEARVTREARRRTHEARMRETWPADMDAQHTHLAMRCYREALDWLATRTGQAALAAATADYRARLVPEITRAHLVGGA